jgi:hypothetical protein
MGLCGTAAIVIDQEINGVVSHVGVGITFRLIVIRLCEKLLSEPRKFGSNTFVRS